MKHLPIILILFASTLAFGIEAPEWADPNRYEGFDLIYAEPNHCQHDYWAVQWWLVDSKDGTLVCRYVELPAGAVSDPNGLVEVYPPLPGIYYILTILSCEPNDPNACVWPEERREAIVIRVDKSIEWETDFSIVVGGRQE